MPMQQLTPIRNEADLLAALSLIDQLAESDPKLGTPAGDLLDAVATLVEAYERKHHPVEPLLEPIGAIEFRMEQAGLKPVDLVPMIGNLNRVYEVLNGKRKLTLRMIRNLNQGLGIPLTALVGKAPDKSRVAMASEEQRPNPKTSPSRVTLCS